MIEIVIMVGVLIALVIVAIIFTRKQNASAPEVEEVEIPSDCCGSHSVCQRDSLLSSTDDIVYFDDEELDQLSGKPFEEMTDEDLESIEDVFYTLKDSDVAGWLRSMQLRNIEVPSGIREQALLIVSERRDQLAQASLTTS